MTQESSPSGTLLYRFGPFLLDAEERRLSRAGEPVELRAKALDLLIALVQAGGHIRSREELIAALWPDTLVEEHGLTVSVNALRRALGDGAPNRYIETIRGHGYRFIAPVEAVPPDEPEDVGAASAAIEADNDGIAAEAAPTRPRIRPLAVAALVAAIVIAGVLIWRFAPFGTAGERPAKPVIAVLPFENLSADKSNAYFSAGIQDTILS